MKKTCLLFLFIIGLLVNTEAGSRIIIHNSTPVIDTTNYYILPLTICIDTVLFQKNLITLSGGNATDVDTIKSDKLTIGSGGFYLLKIYEDSTCNAVTGKLEVPLALGIDNKSFSIKIKAYRQTYHPGLIYYDALKLKEVKANPANDSLHSIGISILKYYRILTLDDLKTTLYFEDYVVNDANLFQDPGENGILDASDSNTIKGNNLSSSPRGKVGGMNITNIADGFAKFIVERTKQELSISFFEKFQEELEKYPDLQTVFPQTFRTLSAIGEEIYMFEAYLMALRESFEEDLSSLPSNLHSIIDNHEVYFDKMPELKAELLSVFFIAEAFQDRQHPGEIIEALNTDIFDSDKNIKATLQTLQLLSRSLRSNNDTLYWVTSNEIKKLINDDDLFKIFLGLVYQTAKNEHITFVDKNHVPVNLAERLKMENVSLVSFKTYISCFAQKALTLECKIRGIEKTMGDSLLFENYYSIVSSSIDLMKYSTGIERLLSFDKDSITLDAYTKQYFDIAQSSADIAVDVSRRNYSSAIVDACQIISYAATLNDTLFGDAAQKLLKYGSFMSMVVQAKSSDDVEDAIEAIALPAGSARIKRESAFNVSLNAYCGLNFMEYNLTTKTKYFGPSVTAPIGFTVSTNLKTHSSFSLFASLVDIGALAAFRFVNSDSILTDSTIHLKDIFSPGIYFSWGIPKSPISINLGYQIIPLLGAVSTNGNTYMQKASRIGLSVCVDLPLLNLYTKQRSSVIKRK
jgi:hypothetical protein